MSIKHLQFALNETGLTGAEKATLVALCNCVADDGIYYIRQKTLSLYSGNSRETVNRHLKKFKEMYDLTITPTLKPDGSRGYNCYDFKLPGESASLTPPSDAASQGGVGSMTQVSDAASLPPPHSVTESVTQRHNNKDHERPTKDQHLEGFEKFCNQYPSRGDHSNPKKPAFESWKKALARGNDPEAIIEGAAGYFLACQRARTDPRMVAQMTTFLNQDRWTQYQLNGEKPPADDDWKERARREGRQADLPPA